MRDWLRLIRVTGLCTIASNILAAISVVVYAKVLDYALLGGELIRNWQAGLWTVLASCLLYASGMMWNDIADVERDKRIHPKRPLPSGRISLSKAYTVGLVLATGALLAAAQLGYRGLCMAGVVLSLALLYNFTTKHIPYLGSVTMGLVRATHAIFCLLMLGPSYFDRLVQSMLASLGLLDRYFATIPPTYPALLLLYVIGVTLISELETRRGRRIELIGAGLLVFAALGMASWQAITAHWLGRLHQQGQLALMIIAVSLLLVLIIWQVWRIAAPWARAIKAGQRDMVTPVLIAGLSGLLFFDALIACAFHPLIGIAVLSLIIPFKILAHVARMD